MRFQLAELAGLGARVSFRRAGGVSLVIPGRPEGANPESRHTDQACCWIPDRCHSASKTRVNALMAASKMTEVYSAFLSLK
jgi:hypothetical protein